MDIRSDRRSFNCNLSSCRCLKKVQASTGFETMTSISVYLSLVFTSDVWNASASGSVTLLCHRETGWRKDKLDGSGDGRNGRFPFLPSPLPLPFSLRCLRRRENRRKQKEKSLILVFAPPPLLCLGRACFHGDITGRFESFLDLVL